MTAKAKVKVIKKGGLKTVESPVKIENQPKQAAAREMVATVSNWVSDFQKRRRVETKQALEKLFAAQPKTSEL